LKQTLPFGKTPVIYKFTAPAGNTVEFRHEPRMISRYMSAMTFAIVFKNLSGFLPKTVFAPPLTL
jgi:hypothetical protein